MDHSGQALNPQGGYRFQADRLFFTFAFLAALAGISHALEQPWLAVALIPLAMLFQRMNAYRFLVLIFAGYLVFFPPHMAGSNLVIGFVTDGLFAAFALLLLFSRWMGDKFTAVRMDSVFLPMYAFTAYVLVLAAAGLYAGTPFMYVFYDTRSVLYLPLGAALLSVDGYGREPKKVFLLLSSFVFLSSIHSLWAAFKFASSMSRVVTWNEIFLSDAVIVSAFLLEAKVGKKVKWLLGAGLLINLIGLVATQTRGLWLSTVLALALVYGIRAVASKTLRLPALIWGAVFAVLVMVVINLAMASLTGMSLEDLVIKRFAADIEPDELINPYTSIGYRIHESWVIWDQRTFFGHGTGALLHLFSTLYRPGYYLDWWAIHSGYFEILHKWGFVGLGIFLWMFWALFASGWRKARSNSKATALFGSVIIAVLANHAFVSVTSGYFLRWSSIVLTLLYFITGKLDSDVADAGRSPAKAAPPIGA
jgi:hypothetical protein